MREDNYGNFVSKSKATVRMCKLPVKGRRLGMETSQEGKDVAGYKCFNLKTGICRMLETPPVVIKCICLESRQAEIGKRRKGCVQMTSQAKSLR